MGFWEKMGSQNGDRRRPRKKRSSVQYDMTDQDENGFCEPKDAPGDFSLEGLLAQWDMCEIDPDHPEWLRDPEFLRGFALVQIMNPKAIEEFANAASKGNILAIVAFGDFIYRMFELEAGGRRYRYGTKKYADGLIKWAMSIYTLAMMHKPYFEKMQERLSMLKMYFLHEEEFMSIFEEIGEKLDELTFDHPEDFRKVFAM